MKFELFIVNSRVRVDNELLFPIPIIKVELVCVVKLVESSMKKNCATND